MLALVEDGEGVVREQAGEALARGHAGDPPAHEPADRARLVQADLLRGRPQHVGLGGRRVRVRAADRGVGQPAVEVVGAQGHTRIVMRILRRS